MVILNKWLGYVIKQLSGTYKGSSHLYITFNEMIAILKAIHVLQ